MITIQSNSNRISYVTPTVHDLLNKVKTLQEIKKIFLQKIPAETPSSSGMSITATQAALAIEKKTLKEIITADSNIAKLERVAEDLLNAEKKHPHSVVCYHGNKSSLIPDTYGSLAHTLNIGGWDEENPLPRLQASFFEKEPQALLENDEIADDHWETMRCRFIAASPTLISDIGSNGLENALHFYSRGECIDKTSAFLRLSRLLETWGIEESAHSSLALSISKLESDFPQYGFIYQIFLHDYATINNISYPSRANGIPLSQHLAFSTTTEFLSALNSENPEEIAKYQQKYYIEVNDVQLRLLVKPDVFCDKDKVTIYSHRRYPISTEEYREKIRESIVYPLLEAGLKARGPAGLFSLSPLAKTLGPVIPRLARLTDYVFAGTDNLRIWIVYGNKEAVAQALSAKRLSAISTFETEETALELALMAGQEEIFELLFEQLKESGLGPTEKLATKLLPLCSRHSLIDATLYFLDYTSDPDLIKDVLINACEKNLPKLICGIIDTKYKKGLVKLREMNLDLCIKHCLKNKNLEFFEWFLREHIRNIENLGLRWSFIYPKLLFYVIEYLPPETLENMITNIGKMVSDTEFHYLEKCLISKCKQEKFFPDSYKAYYASLSQEERPKLPLQEWWQLQFENEEMNLSKV